MQWFMSLSLVLTGWDVRQTLEACGSDILVGHSSLHIRDCLKQDGSRGHPGLPDRQIFVMAHSCPQTHEHRHTDIRQRKNLCESLKKKTPAQLIFSQNTALLNHTPFYFLRFSSFSFIFLLSLKRHQNKRNRLNWRNLFTFSPKYIDDIIIDKFWCTGKPSCPPFFF